jgi:SAM-dependent methyltransferase
MLDSGVILHYAIWNKSSGAISSRSFRSSQRILNPQNNISRFFCIIALMRSKMNKMTQAKSYWDEIYNDTAPDEVSWYRSTHEFSLRLIDASGVKKEDWIIDVGAGASTLIDQLIARGFDKLALLDVSPQALAHTKSRLGELARRIEFIESDIKDFQPQRKFAVWHDRAVFHFLTNAEDRRAYVQALKRALLPGGHVIIATFAMGGPTQCSGLDIVQYDSARLSQELGDSLELLGSQEETHRTPWDSEQKFIYCHFRSRG